MDNQLERRRNFDLEIGKLIASVESLTIALESVQGEIKSLEARMNTGKGIFIGAMMLAGGVGAGASHIIQGFFK